jgi:hypothetical protein
MDIVIDVKSILEKCGIDLYKSIMQKDNMLEDDYAEFIRVWRDINESGKTLDEVKLKCPFEGWVKTVWLPGSCYRFNLPLKEMQVILLDIYFKYNTDCKKSINLCVSNFDIGVDVLVAYLIFCRKS